MQKFVELATIQKQHFFKNLIHSAQYELRSTLKKTKKQIISVIVWIDLSIWFELSITNEGYFDLVQSGNERKRCFQRVITPGISDIVFFFRSFFIFLFFVFFCLQNWLSAAFKTPNKYVHWFFPQNQFEYLSFETNLASLAKTV